MSRVVPTVPLPSAPKAAGKAAGCGRSPWLDLRRVAADLAGRRFEDVVLAPPRRPSRMVFLAPVSSFTGCSID